MSPQEKLLALQNQLASLESIAVAFSGGVDSTLLLRVARDLLGAKRVLAVTAVSPFFPIREQKESKALAAQLGVHQELISIDPLQTPEVTRNDAKRCYYCKKVLMRSCLDRAQELGFPRLVDGSNLDDLSDYRPGSEAIKELGISSPLVTAGLTKQDIRFLSHQLGLPTADKPAFACLASRIPYGTAITTAALSQVETCEAFLNRAGLNNYRVRHHGNTARIEVPPAQLYELIQEPLRSELVAHCKQAGFHFVTLDLEGYRTGSLNEELS
ncbi:TIGR00268 family protein [Syntrophotalea acetylenivorans]|uniref:TIGR00268 family protein n=1 Tax=Syntrophotalea acetylenivorans TaxID=1842532 RepID=A0A1L3GS66_9BACT|nr:ATP-dependent sacrificial sulfur transferase LarE [Syntrophotalea acetylenivorans]APG28796.1 TIGR00268 family protein [Syntrophotalea acetylenivorans]